MPAKLIKPIPISSQKILEFHKLQGKMLLAKRTGQMFFIGKFSTEKITTTRKTILSRTEKVSTQLMLTELDIFSWQKDLKFWGTLASPSIPEFLQMMDLIEMRNDFIKLIVEPFDWLGMQLKTQDHLITMMYPPKPESI